jgi:hypothetical protein
LETGVYDFLTARAAVVVARRSFTFPRSGVVSIVVVFIRLFAFAFSFAVASSLGSMSAPRRF